MTDDTNKNPDVDEATPGTTGDDESTQIASAPNEDIDAESDEDDGVEETQMAQAPQASAPDHSDDDDAFDALDSLDEHDALSSEDNLESADNPAPISQASPTAVKAEMPQFTSGVEAEPASVEVENASQMVENLQTSLSVEMGRVSMPLRALGELRTGQIVELAQKPGDPVDLVVGDKSIGKGELVNIEGELGVRILSLVK